MRQLIQQKYNSATETYGRITAILNEYGDKPMPQEKANEVDNLFTSFDTLMAEAKRMERAAALETQIADLSTPQNGLDSPKNMPGRPGEGRDVAPNTQGGGDDTALYMKAWDRALRGGTRVLTQAEAKALRADSDPAGGYLTAPMQVVNDLIKFVDDQVHIRQLATVYRLERAESLGVPTMDSDLDDAAWTSELKTGTADTAEPFGRRALKPSPLAKRIKIAKPLLRHATVNVDGMVRERVGYKFGVAQENGYLTGSGTNQPLGVFTLSTQGIDSTRDVTALAAAAFDGDDFINTKYKLKAAYWPRARWILHRDVLKLIRKLKDNNDNYIWSPGLGPGGGITGNLPATLVDTPYLISEFAPSTVTTGLYTAVIGDFSYYWIAEALNLEIQVVMELYAETNEVGYIARQEIDGQPVLAEAFARLKMA